MEQFLSNTSYYDQDMLPLPNGRAAVVLLYRPRLKSYDVLRNCLLICKAISLVSNFYLYTCSLHLSDKIQLKVYVAGHIPFIDNS